MKPGLFSFIGDEFENVFQYSDLFLPGIEKIAGIYFSQKEKKIRILSRKRDHETDDNFEEFLRRPETMVMIQKFRTENHQFAWIKKEDLPFEITPQRLTVPTIFTELDNVILVLRFKNDHDMLNDLLMIYFNQNLGNFGLNKADKVLTADHKIIIGHLLYYQFKSFLQLNMSNRKLLRTLNNSVMSVIGENMFLKEQLNQIKASYGDNMINVSIQHLQDLAKEYGRTYVLTEEAGNKIKEFKGNLKHLPSILENAIIFTENLLMTGGEAEIVNLQSFSLDFDSYQVVEKSEQFTRKIDSRQSRAMQFLDKLEMAAISLKNKNISIISSKVGRALIPPISAPAITDALGKNRELIKQLIEKYPDKWETIRKEFKPLANQLRKSASIDLKEESA
jgi:hypothetical protein